jgi:hypothetical protein
MDSGEGNVNRGHIEARHVSYYRVLKNAPTNRSFSGRIRSQPVSIVCFLRPLMLVSR